MTNESKEMGEPESSGGEPIHPDAQSLPGEVSEAAKAAYLARRECQAAELRKVASMRALTVALRKHGMNPEQIQVGIMCGSSLVSVMDWPDLYPEHSF